MGNVNIVIVINYNGIDTKITIQHFPSLPIIFCLKHADIFIVIISITSCIYSSVWTFCERNQIVLIQANRLPRKPMVY